MNAIPTNPELYLARPDVVLHHAREAFGLIALADRALEVLELDHRHLRLRRAENRPVLRNPVEQPRQPPRCRRHRPSPVESFESPPRSKRLAPTRTRPLPPQPLPPRSGGSGSPSACAVAACEASAASSVSLPVGAWAWCRNRPPSPHQLERQFEDVKRASVLGRGLGPPPSPRPLVPAKRELGVERAAGAGARRRGREGSLEKLAALRIPHVDGDRRFEDVRRAPGAGSGFAPCRRAAATRRGSGASRASKSPRVTGRGPPSPSTTKTTCRTAR